MRIYLAKTVASFLKEHPDQKFTSREIATHLIDANPRWATSKKDRTNKSTDEELLTQVTAEVSSSNVNIQKANPKIKIVKINNKFEYYFTELTDEQEIAEEEVAPREVLNNATTSGMASSMTGGTTAPSNAKAPLAEKDLYPILSEYLHTTLAVNSKRIDEGKSSNNHGSNGNKWLHPDLVGLENLSDDWSDEVKGCVKNISDKTALLWSFEVKKHINRSNVREVFFQTVSNSSWANYSYLVASSIDSNTATTKELQMLCALHSVGVILLNTENPSESQIMIPAKERPGIDWDSVDRLVKENRDFKKYIGAVLRFYQTGTIVPSEWYYSPSHSDD